MPSALPPFPRFFISCINALTLSNHSYRIYFTPLSPLPWPFLEVLTSLNLYSGHSRCISPVIMYVPLKCPDAHIPSRFNTSGATPPADRCVAPPILRECSAYYSCRTPATDTTCHGTLVARARVHIDHLPLPQPNATNGVDGRGTDNITLVKTFDRRHAPSRTFTAFGGLSLARVNIAPCRNWSSLDPRNRT